MADEFGLGTLLTLLVPKLAPIVNDQIGFFARDLGRGAVPPRIVIIPDVGRVGDAPPDVTPKPLHLRQLGIDFHLWGTTITECERLQGAVFENLRAIVGSKGYVPGSEKWVQPAETESGFVLIQTVAVKLPTIPSSSATSTKRTTKITSTELEQVPGTTGDGQLDYGEDP